MKANIVKLAAALIVLAFCCATKADLVFDSGYNTFDDNDPYYDEVWVINDAVLDVLGGAMWKLELTDYAIANVYAGEMDTLFIGDSSVANIDGGTLNTFGAWTDSVAYLYAYDVTYHPTGGLSNEGWLEGKYYSDDSAFSFSFYTDTTYSHLTVVPEPSSLALLALGSLLLRRRRYKATLSHEERRTMRKIVLSILLVLGRLSTAEGSILVLDSGHHTWTDANDYYDEVWLENDASLDFIGGSMGHVDMWNNSLADIDGGSMDYLCTYDNSVVNLFSGSWDWMVSGNDSTVYLYAYDVTHDPTGGTFGEGFLEGYFYKDDSQFSFSLLNPVTYPHIQIVPEPTTLLLVGLGGVLLLRRWR